MKQCANFQYELKANPYTCIFKVKYNFSRIRKEGKLVPTTIYLKRTDMPTFSNELVYSQCNNTQARKLYKCRKGWLETKDRLEFNDRGENLSNDLCVGGIPMYSNSVIYANINSVLKSNWEIARVPIGKFQDESIRTTPSGSGTSSQVVGKATNGMSI